MTNAGPESLKSRAPDTTKRPGRTVGAWLESTANGDDLLAALQAVRQAALDAVPAHLWIHLCPTAAWQAQLDLLTRRLAEHSSPAQVLKQFPLLGVPFAVKDNIDIGGEPTTAACPAITQVAARHATAVQRLLDAGAVWVGKTNLDQFATGLVGARSPYGRPASAADAQRVSGGSSSGSAIAVARGVVAFALGTDTAGSGRVPAGFNGLVGLKPTPGRASASGVLPACRTLDCVSIFSHTVADAAHVLSVMEGADASDPYSAFAPGPKHLGAGSSPNSLRVGVPSAPTVDGVIGYDTAWSAGVSKLQADGYTVTPIDFAPLHAVAALLYEGPWVAERHAVLQALLQEQPEALDATVRAVVSRAVGMTATDTFKAQYRLREMQSQLKALWQQVDVLMVPTAPTHPRFDELDADPIGVNGALGLYTNFVNLLGWAALAVPAGTTPTGLPVGVTFIGPANTDAGLAALGAAWCGETLPSPWLNPPATQATLDVVVVGAHLSGLPLNGQLLERGATLKATTHTAPVYRLYALPGTVPPKPGLVRASAAGEGGAIAVEVWSMPMHAVGSFLALIPPPLGLGSIELADGRYVHGFLCEAHALHGAREITALGGWRAYLQSLKSAQPAQPA